PKVNFRTGNFHQDRTAENCGIDDSGKVCFENAVVVFPTAQSIAMMRIVAKLLLAYTDLYGDAKKYGAREANYFFFSIDKLLTNRKLRTGLSNDNLVHAFVCIKFPK
ncbi:hypothetical protein D917_07696, partial [Trichinella nativa]